MSESDMPTDATKDLRVTHDTFFVEAFQLRRIAKAFLKRVLPPKTLKLLDLDVLTVLPRHVTNALFKGKIADVIYRVPIRKTSQHIDLFVVLEHKSQNEFLTIFQLWGYVQRLCEQNLREAENAKGFKAKTYRLPPVMPIIVHHGTSAFTGKTQLSELFVKLPEVEKYLPMMEAVLFDLSLLNDDELPQDVECPEFRAVLLMMKAVFRRDVGAKLRDIIESLRPQSDVPEFRRLIRLFWLYTVYNAKFLGRDYELVLPVVQETTGDRDMPTMVEKWLAEGEARGEARGKAATVVKIMAKKFGPVPKRLSDQVLQIGDFVVLDSLTELALDCQSLDEFAAALK